MNKYKSLEDIKLELKRLNLERQISKEQLKMNYYNLREDLQAESSSNPIVKFFSKIGMNFLIKRLVR